MSDTKRPGPPNTPTAAGFWSGARIRDRLEVWKDTDTPIISPPPEDRNIGRASVRLTVGEEIYISPASEADTKTRQLLKDRQSLVIPSGQFAFLSTAETVCVPNDAIAFITVRSKEASFRGLVNVSGFHVDPGYVGQLIFSVFNAGPGPVQVTLGDPWFEIFFADLVQPEVKDYDPDKGYTGIPTRLITPLAKQFHSFAGLENEIKETKEALLDRITALEREHTVVRWAAVLVAGAIVTVALRALWPNPNEGGVTGAADKTSEMTAEGLGASIGTSTPSATSGGPPPQPVSNPSPPTNQPRVSPASAGNSAGVVEPAPTVEGPQ